MDFETSLKEAKKLAALAADASGAADGERETALRMLREHMERNGLTEADVFGTVPRVDHEVWCYVTRKTAKLDPDLFRLATQLAGVVREEAVYCRWRKDTLYIPQRGLKPDKERHCWMVSCEMTPAEAADWECAFRHYARNLVDTMKELRDAARRARRAVKFGYEGFLYEFHLFPPPSGEEKGGKLNAADTAAIIAAMNSVQGEKWERRRLIAS